ncbi:MAG: TonB-dependent siderophore receptor [Acidobacteriota bacterium]
MKIRFFRRNAKRLKVKEQEKNSTRQRGPKYWLTMGTMGALLAWAPTDINCIKSVYAHTTNNAVVSSYWQAQEQSQEINFNIAEGTLDTVLNSFQSLTGWKVTVNNDAIRELTSPGVTGVYSIEKALKQLLAGTGVTYRFTAADSVTLVLEGASEVVEVRDTAMILSSPKFSEPLRDTPQSISVVSRQVIEDQGATTLRDVLRNVAGISLAAGEGGVQGDNLTIRGFSARNDLTIDGMRDFGSYYRDPFNLEEVAVLKGPSSVTNGRGSTGGTVNQSSKSPTLRPFISGTLEFGSDETKRATLDINQLVPKLGKGAAFRLNLMGNDSEVADRDIAQNRRYGFAPSLALGLGTSTRLTFSYFHQSANDIPDYGIPYLFDRPAPVPRSNYYGFKNANFLKTNVDIGTIKFEHDFNDAISIRNQVRYTRYEREALITTPTIAGTVTLTTPLSAIKVTRNQISVDSEETFFQNQFDVTTKFQTGFIKYTFVSGIEAGRETSKPTRLTYTGVPLATLLNPNTNEPFSGMATLTSKVRTTAVSFGAYTLGTVKFGEKFDVIGGLRFDRFDASFRQFIGRPIAFTRVDNFTSYRAALVYKPITDGSIYFSYSTSFNPSAEGLSLTAGNANLAPEKNRTYEVGSKWDLLSRKLSVRGAVFRTEKTNARETDPVNPLLTFLSGKQRVDGFEVEATGRMTNRWQLIASYALVDSELVESKFFPKAIGSQLANVPRNTFSFSSNHQLPWRLTVGLNGQYVDTRTASSTTPLDPITRRIRKAPDYFVLNMLAKRTISEHLDLQVNIYNLTDKFYIDQVGGSRLVPGAGRTIKVGLNFKLR